MIRNPDDNVQGLIVINALIYILCIPNIFPVFIEIFVGISAFLLSGYIAYISLKLKDNTMFKSFALLSFVYNPFFLFLFNIKDLATMDLFIALSLFIVAGGLYKLDDKSLGKLVLAVLTVLAILFGILFFIFLMPLTIK